MIIGPALRAGWKKLGDEAGRPADRVTQAEAIREGNLFSPNRSRPQISRSPRIYIYLYIYVIYIYISSSCSDCTSSQVAPRELNRALNRIPITDTRLE